MFAAGEAEADEPLPVKLPRRLLQQRHPPPIVLHQVVVGGENVGNTALDLGWGEVHDDLTNAVGRSVSNLGATGTRGDLMSNVTRIEKVVQESLVEASFIQINNPPKPLVVEKTIRCRNPHRTAQQSV